MHYTVTHYIRFIFHRSTNNNTTRKNCACVANFPIGPKTQDFCTLYLPAFVCIIVRLFFDTLIIIKSNFRTHSSLCITLKYDNDYYYYSIHHSHHLIHYIVLQYIVGNIARNFIVRSVSFNCYNIIRYYVIIHRQEKWQMM